MIVATKIIIIKSDRLGDILLSSGYFKNLCDSFPHARIDIWLSPDMLPTIPLLPARLNVMPLPFDRFLSNENDTIMEWLKKIEKQQYDLLIIPQFTLGQPETLALTYLPIQNRQGFKNAEKPFDNQWLEQKLGIKALQPISVEGPEVDAWSSEIDKLAELASWQGLLSKSCMPKIELMEAIKKKDDDQLISTLVWPGSGDIRKSWPAEHFTTLIKILDLKGVITIGGIPTEKPLVEKIANDLEPNHINVEQVICNPDDLWRTARFLCRFSRIISNDTGISHLAATLGVFTIAISGAQHQGRFVLQGKAALTIFTNISCRRCKGNCIFDQKIWPCVNYIDPKEVAEQIKAFKGGRKTIFVKNNFVQDPERSYAAIHRHFIEIEQNHSSKILALSDSINKGNAYLKDAETLRDQWKILCREAEIQRDQWKTVCREAEIQRDQWMNLCKAAENQRDLFLNYFPWMNTHEEQKTAWLLPKISIITPSLNQGKYIEENILSVLNQNYINFEHTVIDAGSTDKTLAVLKKYPHLRWISEKDQGQSHAINKGILMSSGDIIAYLNSDDIYRPDAFKIVAKIFTEEPTVQILVGDCDYIDEHSNITGFLKAKYDNIAGLIRYWGWEQSYCIPQQSVFIRRSLLSEVGLFDINFDMTMDYEMWLRVVSTHKFRILHLTLAAFRLTSETKTVSRTHEMYLEQFKASRMYWTKLPLMDRFFMALASHHQIGKQMLGIAEHYAFNPHPSLSPRSFLGIAFCKWPFMILNVRTHLTMLQYFFSKSNHISTIRFIHRAYLHIVWLLSKFIHSSM